VLAQSKGLQDVRLTGLTGSDAQCLK
jgi:hypothetical protein